jgi:hypothetical protein
MKKCLLLLFLALVIVGISFSQQPAQAVNYKKNACIQCHEFMGGAMGQPVRQWFGSAHQTKGIVCQLCHGGKASIQLPPDLKKLAPEEIRELSKKAMYSRPNFVGAPSGQAQLDVCGRCHRSIVQNYGSSLMGEAYLLKQGGPSCAQCHDAHRFIIPAVPEACKGCHQDTTGFGRIIEDVHIIDKAQVEKLARIRIQIAGEKVAGKGPIFQQHLESFETGLVSWGLVIVLFLVAVGLYQVIERKGK